MTTCAYECRLKGAAIAAYDGLNFAAAAYSRDASQLADVPFAEVVASLRASGMPMPARPAA